ncbi:hypothetical protein [Polyangium spumosum]|uniref:Uncharacterized protein n=1 Tax=Polyangium spumosum TaxID=889282 RepID=A0A6N7PVR9_9BACT|nr:hypothetical protein [Polyangium spumosum]MRG96009.1 hypothetical protein [Polyangium spumosum]
MGKGYETRIGAIIGHIITLAEERDEEYDANRKGPYPLRDSADVVREAMESIRLRRDPDARKAKRPCESKLQEYLLALDPKDLWKVQVVKRAGRDDDDILSLSRRRQVESHAVTARMMAEEECLAEDLEKGLAIAKRDGVDLDTDI